MSEPILGEIRMFAGNFAPRNWALCNGQLLSVSQNSALFSILGTTYGGNGVQTFALPNLQGRVAIHAGQSPGTSLYTLGESAGTENQTLLQTQMPMHTHVAMYNPNGGTPLGVSIATADTPATASTPGGNILAQGKDARNGVVSDYAATSAATGSLAGVTMAGSGAVTVAPAGGSSPVPVVQPYQVVNYIIAIEGTFPSRN
jgi:microcystin-dependent protein